MCHSRASPFLVASQILHFCHSRDHHLKKFLSIQAVTSFTLQFIAISQPKCQPNVHPWATHAHFSQYLVPEISVIPTKSVPECLILHVVPETPIFMLGATSGAPPPPPIVYFAVAHIYHECPPPPRVFYTCTYSMGKMDRSAACKLWKSSSALSGLLHAMWNMPLR